MKQELNKFYKENFGSFSNLALKEIEELCLYEQHLAELPDIWFISNDEGRNSKKSAETRRILHTALTLQLANSTN